MKSALLTCLMFAFSSVAMAQAPAQTPPPSSTTPSSASSPHQRETTSKETNEAPAAQSSEPTSASSPHQQKVAEGSGKAKHDKMVNDCITKRQSETASLSRDDAKKACEAQMKKQRAQ